MNISFKKQCLLLLSFTSASCVHADLYQQILPEIVLKNVNIEEPSETEVTKINACRALTEFGSKLPEAASEDLKAILSIDIKSMLSTYGRTLTVFGDISLAKRCAQMTDNINTLQTRQHVFRHLESNPATTSHMSKIVQNCALAEQKFLQHFKQVSEEEQLLQDATNKQLYFSRLGLNNLNESAWALEVGPRLNQLYTLGWFTIPPVIASIIHKNVTYNIKALTLENQKFFLNLQISLKDRSQESIKAELINTQERQKLGYWVNPIKIKALEEHEKFQNISIDEIEKTIQKTTKELEDLQKSTLPGFFKTIAAGLREKDPKDLTKREKNLVKHLQDDPDSRETTILAFKYFAPPIIKKMTKDGIKNIPSMSLDIAKVIKNEITEQAFFNSFKESLVKNENYDPKSFETNAIAAGSTLYAYALASIYPLILYKRHQSTKNLLTLIHEKQADLLIAGHLIKSMEMLYSIISEDEVLKKSMPSEHKMLATLFNPKSCNTSSDLKHLISQLLSSSFQGSDSYLLSQEGKILATHHLLLRIKGELIPYFETLGDIDAHLAIFTLYKEFKNHPRVTFCLPEYVNSQTPTLEAQGFWHPLISPDFVISNDLTMGQNGAANLIITGPNAGGKTTSLMSLVINIIFAQSFGIAPSTSLRITPFAKIHSYLDITTNLQEGLSLFAAEVDRSKKLKQSILSCTPGQKTFTIIDELFSGTAPDVASNVGFKFAQQLGDMKHSMSIITTHFPRLTDLEAETSQFENYKVADATFGVNGKVIYPFKLVKGASTQNIAQHMLEQEGII